MTGGGEVESGLDALNTKVDERLQDTRPLWEGLNVRLDHIGTRLDHIDGRLDNLDKDLRQGFAQNLHKN